MGFIWADGYVVKRNRTDRIEYNLKIGLSEVDVGHLEKFICDLSSNYPIHYYKCSNSTLSEARLFICNQYLASYLYNDLSIIPRRYDPSKVISIIPKEYHRDFIRGAFDGDGSTTKYLNQGKYKKAMTTFGGSEELLRFIEKHLDDNLLHNGVRHKFYQRHKGRDGVWKVLNYSGTIQAKKVLDYIYKDATIYLDRKYHKYQQF